MSQQVPSHYVLGNPQEGAGYQGNQFSKDKIRPLMGQSNSQDWILCVEVTFLACTKEDRNCEL
jgi:hypothetical protein